MVLIHAQMITVAGLTVSKCFAGQELRRIPHRNFWWLFWIFLLIKQCEGLSFSWKKVSVFDIGGLVQLAHTFDERNPQKPVGMYKTLKIMG